MNEHHLSHGLATLAEDMPTPDIGDIVATARTRIRRRRAVGATWVGTAAVVGVLTGTIVATGDHSSLPATNQPAGPGSGPSIDDRARALDQQLSDARSDLIPGWLTVSPDPLNPIRVDGRVLGFEFSTSGAPVGTLMTDGIGVPITQAPVIVQAPFTGPDYQLDVKLSDSQGWGTLSVAVQHTHDTGVRVACLNPIGVCQPSDLPDGTMAIVTTGVSANGNGTIGTDVHLQALRPDGTYIDAVCTNLPAPPGGAAQGATTLSQPPLNAAELLKFADVFTY